MEVIVPTEDQRRSTQLRLQRSKQVPVVHIAGREIGPNVPPYIVAEISCNHSGSLDKARRLISAAKEAGADAVKIQSYLPEDLTTPQHKELWALYQRAYTPREWHKELFAHAAYMNLTLFGSVFSVSGVKFLNDLGAPAFKIASPEIKDLELVSAAFRTRKPVIMSAGMATLRDIRADAIWLHCVAKYPSQIEDANLRGLASLRSHAPLVGLSDHTAGWDTAIAATALGAVMIEKHFKIDDDCIDAAWSLDVPQFAAMCAAVRAIWKGMGTGEIAPTCQPRSR